MTDELRRLAAATPPGTRLILASEGFLSERWDIRTGDGYRINIEWGDPEPEGWYEPTFTVNQDDRSPKAAARPDQGVGGAAGTTRWEG